MLERIVVEASGRAFGQPTSEGFDRSADVVDQLCVVQLTSASRERLEAI